MRRTESSLAPSYDRAIAAARGAFFGVRSAPWRVTNGEAYSLTKTSAYRERCELHGSNGCQQSVLPDAGVPRSESFAPLDRTGTGVVLCRIRRRAGLGRESRILSTDR